MNGTDDEFYDKMHEIIDSLSDPRIKDYLENYSKNKI